jgi:glucose/arabinose dehydrogenase
MNYKSTCYLAAVFFMVVNTHCAQNNTSATSTQTSLPQPHETKSVYNFSTVKGWGNNTTPTAPQGFKVSKFGNDLKNPRWIYVLPNGDILVAEAKKGSKGLQQVAEKVVGKNKAEGDSENMNRITLLRDKNNDGIPEIQAVFLANLNLPFGMALLKNNLYVACTDAVWKFPYEEGDTKITASGEKILDLPTEGHWTRNIIANKSGSKLYISVGSASNVAEDGMDKEKRRACIIEINPDGTGERIYADGLRNPVGMAWLPGTNTLWTVVNERDELGDELVPDYLTSVKEGGFYGWPYSYYGQTLDPRIKDKEQRPDLVSRAIVPDVKLGSHTASLGLAFYDKKLFPAKYTNGAFIGQHGSWNSSQPTGYKVVFVPFKDGKPGTAEDFLTGFMIDPEKNEVHGRPVGVTVLSDGSILVADDAGNMVWRVTHDK